MKEHLELTKVSITNLGNDVLLTKYKDKVKITEADAMEIDGAQLTISQGKDVCIIADLLAGNPIISKDAEDYYINKGRMIPLTKALALVTGHKSSFFGRVFGKSSKALYPTKEFSTVEEAQAWLERL